MSPRRRAGVKARPAHIRCPRPARALGAPVPAVALGLLITVVVVAGVALAPRVELAAHAVVLAQGQTSGQVQQLIDRATDWITGLLAALATLFLTIGAVRYILANGNTSEIEHAKQAVKSAAVGYAFAALAPLIVQILSELVGQR